MTMGAFQEWVSELGGLDQACVLLGVKRDTLRIWYYRRGYPRVETILEIVRLSRGALTIEDVVNSVRPKAAIRRRRNAK